MCRACLGLAHGPSSSAAARGADYFWSDPLKQAGSGLTGVCSCATKAVLTPGVKRPMLLFLEPAAQTCPRTSCSDPRLQLQLVSSLVDQWDMVSRAYSAGLCTAAYWHCSSNQTRNVHTCIICMHFLGLSTPQHSWVLHLLCRKPVTVAPWHVPLATTPLW